jgi:hypothetical protein
MLRGTLCVLRPTTPAMTMPTMRLADHSASVRASKPELNVPAQDHLSKLHFELDAIKAQLERLSADAEEVKAPALSTEPEWMLHAKESIKAQFGSLSAGADKLRASIPSEEPEWMLRAKELFVTAHPQVADFVEDIAEEASMTIETLAEDVSATLKAPVEWLTKLVLPPDAPRAATKAPHQLHDEAAAKAAWLAKLEQTRAGAQTARNKTPPTPRRPTRSPEPLTVAELKARILALNDPDKLKDKVKEDVQTVLHTLDEQLKKVRAATPTYALYARALAELAADGAKATLGPKFIALLEEPQTQQKLADALGSILAAQQRASATVVSTQEAMSDVFAGVVGSVAQLADEVRQLKDEIKARQQEDESRLGDRRRKDESTAKPAWLAQLELHEKELRALSSALFQTGTKQGTKQVGENEGAAKVHLEEARSRALEKASEALEKAELAVLAKQLEDARAAHAAAAAVRDALKAKQQPQPQPQPRRQQQQQQTIHTIEALSAPAVEADPPMPVRLNRYVAVEPPSDVPMAMAFSLPPPEALTAPPVEADPHMSATTPIRDEAAAKAAWLAKISTGSSLPKVNGAADKSNIVASKISSEQHKVAEASSTDDQLAKQDYLAYLAKHAAMHASGTDQPAQTREAEREADAQEKRLAEHRAREAARLQEELLAMKIKLAQLEGTDGQSASSTEQLESPVKQQASPASSTDQLDQLSDFPALKEYLAKQEYMAYLDKHEHLAKRRRTTGI